MIGQEFSKWISDQCARLSRLFPFTTQNEELLGRTAKLTEEVGELAEAVLANMGQQRKEKETNKSVVAAECADVIITTLLLAEKAGVDINKALTERISVINSRFEKMEKGIS